MGERVGWLGVDGLVLAFGKCEYMQLYAMDVEGRDLLDFRLLLIMFFVFVLL